MKKSSGMSQCQNNSKTKPSVLSRNQKASKTMVPKSCTLQGLEAPEIAF